MKIYPAKLYEFMTTIPVKEEEPWDIQSDEFEDAVEAAYENYIQYIFSLKQILIDLKKKGKGDSDEFKKTYDELKSWAPEFDLEEV